MTANALDATEQGSQVLTHRASFRLEDSSFASHQAETGRVVHAYLRSLTPTPPDITESAVRWDPSFCSTQRILSVSL